MIGALLQVGNSEPRKCGRGCSQRQRPCQLRGRLWGNAGSRQVDRQHCSITAESFLPVHGSLQALCISAGADDYTSVTGTCVMQGSICRGPVSCVAGCGVRLLRIRLTGSTAAA
jgi:hypothetical protein